MNNKNILVVDDEPKILEVLVSFLENLEYRVFPAVNGQEALDIFENENISLILLDLMLPDISGEEICTRIRQKSRVPIIMLTAKVAEEDMLKGLNIGADDYITKPFSLKELKARMDAIIRRTTNEAMPLYNNISFDNGNLLIDFESHTVIKNDENISLTPNEFKLLSAMAKYPTKVFTREELIEIALGEEYDGYDRAVDSHIKNLRKKIEDDRRNPKYILTVHGIGYKFGEV